MQPSVHFVDIHCHLLPGLDDGARDWGETLAMARMAVADGVSTVVATPHQLGNHGQNGGRQIRACVDECQAALRRHRIALRVLPGADVRIEPGLVAKIRSGDVVTLADRRRHVLLELPHDLYLPLDRLLAELASAGLVGILSHPERNAGILDRPEIADSLVKAGCLLQITAGSLTGGFGRRSQALAERLVERGLVHFVATDAHGARSRRPLLHLAFQRVAELAGAAVARDLCCANPDRVVAGQRVAPTVSPMRKLTRWFSMRRAG